MFSIHLDLIIPNCILQIVFSPLSASGPRPVAPPANPLTLSGGDFITKHRVKLEEHMGELQPTLLKLQDGNVLNNVERWEDCQRKFTDPEERGPSGHDYEEGTSCPGTALPGPKKKRTLTWWNTWKRRHPDHRFVCKVIQRLCQKWLQHVYGPGA